MNFVVYLDKGRNYEDVKNNVEVSSATIATVAENLGNPGWQEVIRRIKAEEWAIEKGKWGKMRHGKVLYHHYYSIREC